MKPFLTHLRAALDGAGELVLGTDRSLLPAPLPEEVSIVVTTSGSSSGVGRPVGLTPAAIRASARATHERLGGPGQWLLTLPHEHIAGLQVCARSLLAGFEPVIRGDASLAEAISRMDPTTRRYTSLVPTQLVRVLSGPAADLEALATLDAILLGGSAIDPALLREARRAGLTIHTTYGSTETSGGCVYDGTALPGVEVKIGDDGRIWLGGDTLAWGYLDDAPSDFVTLGGTRWFRTNDLGSISADTHGRLVVFGRADDVIITGGVNVHPAAVEATMRELPEVGDCVVVGLPSPEWGAEVAAVVVPREPSALRGEDHLQRRRELLDAIRANARSALSTAAAPRTLVITMRLPTRGPGKVDRRAAADLALTVLAAGEGVRHE
ncbi:MAG TPA: AMP-binding protein [Beutenbergiaceae bacterium]|nr:AMP-binding protein [Beutenbergiaceae bacterium]